MDTANISDMVVYNSIKCEYCLKFMYRFLWFVRDVMSVGSGNMQALDRDVEDTTAQNDVDSGLQMAVSPCSVSTASLVKSARTAAAQHNNDVAVTGTGTFGQSGMSRCNSPFNSPLFRTPRVIQYQKKHLFTHTLPLCLLCNIYN